MKLAMSDFDNDHRQDLLVTKSTGDLMLYRSDGAGKFAPEARRKVGNGWNAVAQSSASFGFQGTGTRGLMAKAADGRLLYYSLGTGLFTGSRTVGNGWKTFSVFR
jgi:D-alanyl-D-alanine carboxypeptidase